MFPFLPTLLSTLSLTFAYDLVKTRLSEWEAEAEGKPITKHISMLCDWVSSSTSASDSNNLVFTRL